VSDETENQSLTRMEPMPLATPAPGEMMQAMIKAGITESNVAAFTELVKLSERMEDRNAAREFNRAFTLLQQEMPTVQALKPVPDKHGNIKYKYAPFEAIMKQVQPYLNKHGFSVRFSSKIDSGKVTMMCTLMHSAGHSVTNEFTVRIGQGPPGASESQADGSAASYAQRGVFCDALNIVVRQDNDARMEGAPITPEQAKNLRERVMSTGSDEAAFLKFSGAKTYEEIPSAKYDLLDRTLAKKEKT